jgi:hypothetical protein
LPSAPRLSRADAPLSTGVRSRVVPVEEIVASVLVLVLTTAVLSSVANGW